MYHTYDDSLAAQVADIQAYHTVQMVLWVVLIFGVWAIFNAISKIGGPK